MYNKRGIIYFINILTSCKDQKFLEMPIEIRELLWKYLHQYPYLSCYICNKILINFDIRIDKISKDLRYPP